MSVALLLVSSLKLQAQSQIKDQYPGDMVGKQCPVYTLENVQYFSQKKVNFSEFKGKWLVLDFWNNGCSACIESFPRINEMVKQFSERVQYLLIGNIDHDYTQHATQALYERCRKRFGLQIPIAYDSLLLRRFNGGGFPFIVIVDPNGTVKAFTNHLAMEDMKAFLSGKDPVLEKATFENEPETPTNLEVPFLAFGNGAHDSDLVYGSVLSKWNHGMRDVERIGRDSLDTRTDSGRIYRFELTQTTVPELYRIAFFGRRKWLDPRDSEYYGKCNFQPILDIGDTTLFQLPNPATGKNFFSYSLVVPARKASQLYLAQTIQADLKRFFGYEVSLETRMSPYLKLVATDEAKNQLKTKGVPDFSPKDNYLNWRGAKHVVPLARHQGFTAKNIPVGWLIIAMNQTSVIETGGLPIIDETGIRGNIDITIDALMFDLDDVKSALQKNGLDLIKGEKEMKVLVIRDPSPK